MQLAKGPPVSRALLGWFYGWLIAISSFVLLCCSFREELGAWSNALLVQLYAHVAALWLAWTVVYILLAPATEFACICQGQHAAVSCGCCIGQLAMTAPLRGGCTFSKVAYRPGVCPKCADSITAMQDGQANFTAMQLCALAPWMSRCHVRLSTTTKRQAACGYYYYAADSRVPCDFVRCL
jgi:hypothetical protein